VDEEFFDEIVNTNFKGVYFTVQRAVPYLNDGASIILISSMACHGGWRSHSVYSYSIYPEGKDGFEPILINTAKYLGMNYLGCYFHYAGDDKEITEENSILLNKFIACLN
jgi:hypothetical protein